MGTSVISMSGRAVKGPPIKKCPGVSGCGSAAVDGN